MATNVSTRAAPYGGVSACLSRAIRGSVSNDAMAGSMIKPRQRVMLAFGTRPEAIKMAPVYHALRADRESFDPFCCVTAQHRDMLDQALEVFGIIPAIDLDLMRAGQGLSDLTASVLTAMQASLAESKPDLVLVHGDTTTTMATALSAFYAGIPVGHVEAGLRSGNLRSPFPEEFNRRAVGMVAQYHFAPTEDARTNLLREECDPAAIVVSGNTVVDALSYVVDRLRPDNGEYVKAAGLLDKDLPFDWRRGGFVLVTCHRRETFGQGLDEVCDAMIELAAAFPSIRFVLPVHPNPMVCTSLRTRLGAHPAIHLTSPLPYDAFILALKHCYFALTDSGGIQEEAPSLGKPVLVMRDVTERPEAVRSGTALLVGSQRRGIVAAVSRLLSDAQEYERMRAPENPYGDGQAARRIADFLKHSQPGPRPTMAHPALLSLGLPTR